MEDDAINREIGTRLKAWLADAGLDQMTASAQTGISIRSMARYVSGERPMRSQHFKALAELGCDLTWLITGRQNGASRSNPSQVAPAAPHPIEGAAARLDAGMWLEVKAIVRMAHRRATGTEISDAAADAVAVRYYNKAVRNGLLSQNIDSKDISALRDEIEQEFGFITPDVPNAAKRTA